MNLIEQHMENVAREEAQLEERVIRLKAEQDETRKLLNNIRRHRKSLCKQYPGSQATLPLAPPDEEEEATDEVDFGSPSDGTGDGGGQWGMPEAEPLGSDGQHPGHEGPEELVEGGGGPVDAEADAETRARIENEAEAAKDMRRGLRRRKAKATAEEVANG